MDLANGDHEIVENLLEFGVLVHEVVRRLLVLVLDVGAYGRVRGLLSPFGNR